MPLLPDLFLTFFKIGLFTFGGGLAMIPFIENLCVEKKKWISHEEMMDITVIAESTPGPIAINCATYVGNKKAGILGALISTLGMVLPSFVIILVISTILDRYLEITWVAKAFMGIKIVVGILITNAGLTMLKKMKKKPLGIAFMLVSLVLMLAVNIFSIKFSSVALIIITAILSLIIYAVRGRKGGAR